MAQVVSLVWIGELSGWNPLYPGGSASCHVSRAINSTVMSVAQVALVIQVAQGGVIVGV